MEAFGKNIKAFLVCLFAGISISSTAVNFSGTYTIGTSGSYTSLTSAFTAISAGTVTGNIQLKLVAGYVSTVETFPIAPSANNGSYTVTIYPGVSGLSITSANNTGTINLNTCDNYVIDGRVNMTGSVEGLIIANTNTAGYCIQFINDATYNTIQYCNIEGESTSASIGVVFFSTAASTGNNYDSIKYCDIHDASSTPYDAVNSTGTNTAGEYNVYDVITNCNIYNFFYSSSHGRGVDIQTGNDYWTVTNNSFYQTTARVPTTAFIMEGVLVNCPNGSKFVISNNYIGGSAANCGGSPLSLDAGATQNTTLNCIYVSASSTSACYVENNTIANIAFGANAQTANTFDFTCICVAGGYIVIDSNTIGGTTGNGSISLSYSTASADEFIMGAVFFDATNGEGSVSNNTFGSITVSGGKSTLGGEVYGIDCQSSLSSDFSIQNNVIGSLTTANSFQYSSATGTPITMDVIYTANTTGGVNLNVTGNTIQNITNASTSTASTLFGIYDPSSSSCITNISGNTIADMSVNIATTTSIIGVYEGNTTTSGLNTSNNIIHDNTNTYSGATADDIYGIYYNASTSTTNTISANSIYNLTLAGTSTSSAIYGLTVAAGAPAVTNNIIDLGNNVSTAYLMYGIYQSAPTNGSIYNFNSVYIGGTPTAVGSITSCYYSSVTSTRKVENNIFYNGRTGGGSKDYSVGISSKTGFTATNNDLYNATAANVGDYGGTAETFANWKTASVQDANSLNVNPAFNSPTTTTPDLHITSGSPVISQALAGTGITVDFDNDIRSSTPDIGADEYHTNYYSKSTGTLDVLGTWGLNTDGTGASPANFTTRNCSFNIRNNATPTLAAAWSVTGSGDLITLGDGTDACNFIIPQSYSVTGPTLNITNNTTLTNQNTTNPTLGIINSNSTVNYNSASGVGQTIATASYGNLIISNSTGSGASTKSLAATISISGNLTVDPYSTFDMVTYNANRTGGGGTLTLSANATLRLSGTTGGASPTTGSSSFPNNFATMAFDPASIVEYYGATQTIYNIPTYGNLTITTAGTKTAGGNLTIAGNLLINTGATFAASTYSHQVTGNLTNSGTLTAGSGTITITGNASNSGTFTGSSGTTNIEGNLTNTGTITGSSGNIDLAGNWNNTGGTFTVNTSTVVFNGSTNQTVTAVATFYNLTMNSTTTVGGGLTFSANTAINNTLTFNSTNSGLINLNSYTLTIGTSATSAGSISYPSTVSGWVYGGTLTRYIATTTNAGLALPTTAAGASTAGFFPLGTSDPAFEPFWFGSSSKITATATGAVSLSQGSTADGTTAITTYTDNTWGTAPGTAVVGVSNADWVVTETSLTLTTSASAQIMFGGENFQTFITGDVNASNATGTAGTYGTPLQLYGTTDFEVKRTALTLVQTTASAWHIGTSNLTTSPLPIQLTTFTAECKNSDAVLQWSTATETNNDHFTVEKTQDGINYQFVATVKGSGTTKTAHYYSAIDYEPLSGTSYYRLSQTDLDGHTTDFNNIPFQSCGKTNGVLVFSNGTNNITVRINATAAEAYAIEVINAQGQTMLSTTENVSTGQSQFDFPIEATSGIYFVRVVSTNNIYTNKVLLMR